ncbi:F-box protein At4g02760 [Neltuma alba]|uniref:F-box protein At4g02760 n=1 Tax=Neltuma alba TaxID=207710 RepID=UPI0010A58917|nr:F-box protein At4g02760-like [Prosopis alba]XP_028804147.1 F-box protein At4g02760-like [Prosopis alba]XP_028804148.1 F-box protein At4g02760-like [Prosopis alba]XP_028804149.1 F-box protein At4g02760-like [Prosopis alba]XP_028804150.1 F-box protein At4g02760-like [Prosopis alba]
MDTLLHASSSMAKRPCPSQNPRFQNLHQVDHLLEAFLALAEFPAFSLHLSLDRLLHSWPADADQTLLIDRALKMGSVLLDAANHSSRKRASSHNSLAWPLPPDLTIKVFSILDTQSLCHAAATCSFFNKCAKDPLCYANLDLTTTVPKINNAVVSSMVQRAGKALRSLKLGVVPGATALPGSQPLAYTIRNTIAEVSSFSWNDKRSRQGRESSILTRSCLTPLNRENGAPRAFLRKLHLYNIERMDNTSLAGALSACPSLLDLEIVGLHVELRHTLASISANCPLIERLFFESSKTGRDDSLKTPTCMDLVSKCPRLASLSLRGFKLHDYKVRILVKGLQKLKYVDFSTSYFITGNFLRNLGSSTSGTLLEVLILRDCMHLKELEVARLLMAILAGDFKSLVHLDISNREGLASEGDWYRRCYNSSIMPIKQVLETRSNMCLLAEFPSEGSYVEPFDVELNSDISLPSQLSSHTSDGSNFMSTSESSYNSDQGSGNEDGQDASYVIYGESSDEIDYFTL